MLASISSIIMTASVVLFWVSIIALVMAIFFRDSRKERKTIFVQSLLSSMLMLYISWLIG